MTQIGLMIEGQWGLTWPRWARILTVAEELGYQCVFRSDHYTIGPPDVDNWNSLGLSMDRDRYLTSATQESAHIYIIGGETDTEAATADVEYGPW